MQKLDGARTVGIGVQLTWWAELCRKMPTANLAMDGHVSIDGIKVDRNTLAYNVGRVQDFCKELSLNDSLEAAFDLVIRLRDNPLPITLVEVATRHETLRESIRNAMFKRAYLVVP